MAAAAYVLYFDWHTREYVTFACGFVIGMIFLPAHFVPESDVESEEKIEPIECKI